MKKTLIMFSVFLCVLAHVRSQNNDSILYLFPEFQDARVYYINGTQSFEKVNYNFFMERLFYIDKKDGQPKVVANIDDVSWIDINRRMFFIENRYIIERISNDPFMEIRYVKRIRDGGPKGAYGGTTETSSATGYVPTRDYWEYMHRLDMSRLIITPMYYEYRIERSGDMKEFRTWNQFYKIYSRQKGLLKKYVKDNNSDLLNINDVMAVYQYAESL